MEHKKAVSKLISSGFLLIFAHSAFATTGKSVKLHLDFGEYAVPYTTFLINGNPIYAMVDTGSSLGLHLYEDQLNRISGLKKEKSYTSTDGRGAIQRNIKYRADTLDINGFKAKNVSITPYKTWGLLVSGEGKLPEGPVAGLGLFKDKQILLDYAANTLTLSDNASANSLKKNGLTEFNYQLSPHGLVFNVEDAGQKYNLILDTGATVSIIWRERLKSSASASCLLVDPEMDNEGCVATILALKSLNGKTQNFGAVVVDGNFNHMGEIDGFLGNNFLKNRKMFIDFKNKKVFISDEQKRK